MPKPRAAKSPARRAPDAKHTTTPTYAKIATEKKGRFTRAQGASSGSETWALAALLMGVLMWRVAQTHPDGWRRSVMVPLKSLALQLVVMTSLDRSMLYYYCFSMRLGPATMRNAMLAFAQCVKPGGCPTSAHALDIYRLPAWLTAALFFVACTVLMALGPFASLVRVFYPEHYFGVNSCRFGRLYFFFLTHPLAVQGEGPSNGDGLSSYCSSESLIYPITPKNLKQGPLDRDYWLGPDEAKPRLRDMFHDKTFCHRFFRSHNVCCPILVAEVERHRASKVHVPADEAPRQLIWKPRYSTMGLGVEHFTGWPEPSQPEWAPSADPYIVEELIQSTEYDHSEWYRCTTLWEAEADSPMPGYIWRMRNPRGDRRVQTDIMGGAFCVTSKYEPFIGPRVAAGASRGVSFDPRTNSCEPLDEQVDVALQTGIKQMLRMHASLGKELYSIGWDVLVRGTTPVFIEFNIGNGFFVADHSIEECEKMADFFSRNFFARLDRQLLSFDPEAQGEAKASGRKKRK